MLIAMNIWQNGSAQRLAAFRHQIIIIDRIVRENDKCDLALCGNTGVEADKIRAFLLTAKRHTYAACDNMTASCRMNSHDFRYEDQYGHLYYDAYLGGERFVGEEALWAGDTPVWAMNYAERVTGENFSGDFLKECLMAVPAEMPFRGPRIYTKGDYHYHCKADGEFIWFHGYEEIFYRDEKIYECYFHGGEMSRHNTYPPVLPAGLLFLCQRRDRGRFLLTI